MHQQTPSTSSVAPAGRQVEGLSALLLAARLPDTAVNALTSEITSLGAVHVQELRAADWSALRSFQLLRELEKRRVLNLVPV